MPNSWLKSLKNTFRWSSLLKDLESELEKEPSREQFNKIRFIVKAMCLKNESIPTTLLNTYPQTLVPILESFSKEAPFDKKIIYHDTYAVFCTVEKNPGEVHCIKYCHPLPPYNRYWHGIEYLSCDVNGKIKRFFLQTQIQWGKEYVFPPDTPENKDLLEEDLIDRRLMLSNKSLIQNALSQVSNYYFNIANNAFRQSNFQSALKACLHLRSNDNEENFNTQFKLTVAQHYLADKKGNLPTVSPIIFSGLRSSHNHPEKIYLSLEAEKTKQKKPSCRA